MAGSAPIYINRVSTEGLGQLSGSSVAPNQITGQAAAQFGNAIGGLGQAVQQVAVQYDKIGRATTIAERETKFLTGIDSLKEEFKNDPDPVTMPQRFEERAKKLREEQTRGLGTEDGAELNLRLTRKQISYTGEVRQTSLRKQADSYSAGLDSQYETLTRRYAQAGSDVEREGIAGEMESTLATGIRDGMTTAKSAEAYRQALRKTGDSAVVLRQIASNPAMAQKALADPAQFAGLDPVQREQLTAQAKAAADERQIAERTYEARTNPATAALRAGRLASPEQAALIFDRAFIPQESGGNPNAVSPAGAAGIAQIMPDTARALVKRMGLGNWDADSDEQIRRFLKEDPKQTRRMGLQYFQDNIAAFNGNIAPAIAAYHAGPGGAVKKAHEAAQAKYGEGYSAQQFLEFMPTALHDGRGGTIGKRTVDYVRDIYGRMGIDLSQPGLSGMASFRASNAVGAEFDRQAAASAGVMRQYVKELGDQVDAFRPLFEKGMVVDPQRLAQIEAPLRMLATRGDETAIRKLADLEEHKSIAPIAHMAWGMRPEDRESELAQLRQRVTIGGDATPVMARRLKVLEGIHAEAAKMRTENPIGLRERQGDPVTPINLQAHPANPEFGQQLAMRGVASQRAQAAYGGEHQFFRPEEKITAKARFEAAGEDERFTLLKAISETVPNEAVYRAAAKELTGGDKLAGTAGMFMRSNPALARDIFRGATLLQQDGVKPKVQELKDALKGAFGGQLYPANVQSDLIDAALAVYASERGKSWSLYDAADRGGLEKAIERVTGRIVSINGRKTPVPASATTWQLERLFGSGGQISDQTIERFGGASSLGGGRFDASFLRRHGQLVPADDRIGDHQNYMLVLPQGGGAKPVMTGDGLKPLIINIPEAIRLERIAADTGRMNTPGGALRAGQLNFLKNNIRDETLPPALPEGM